MLSQTKEKVDFLVHGHSKNLEFPNKFLCLDSAALEARLKDNRFFFSRMYATPRPTLSICLSVDQLVRSSLLHIFAVFGLAAPAQMLK